MIFGQVCEIYPSINDKKVNVGYWDLLGEIVTPNETVEKKTEGGTIVPYCWPYVVGISPYIDLIYGRYLQSIGS